LRLKLGDWFRVVQLLKTGGGGGKYAWGGGTTVCLWQRRRLRIQVIKRKVFL